MWLCWWSLVEFKTKYTGIKSGKIVALIKKSWESVLGKNIQSLFREMSVSDFFFIVVAIANVILLTYLGYGNYQNADKVAATQDRGEAIITWFSELAGKLEANEPIQPAACRPNDEDSKFIKGAKVNHWKDCVEALFAAKGPFESYTNLLKPDGLVYSMKCNRKDLLTSGSFIFEKMTINPAGPPGISPLEPGEKLISGLNIRLSVCDTGYYLVKIGEFKLWISSQFL